MSAVATSGPRRPAVWLDCDPGHDDAMAILLALFAPASDSAKAALDVLGLSTVHGNTTGHNSFVNAARLLAAYGVEPGAVPLWRGADDPLVRPGQVDIGIHGNDGLGGVECLPMPNDERFQAHLKQSNGAAGAGAAHVSAPSPLSSSVPGPDTLGLVRHQIGLLEKRTQAGLAPLSLVATGPLTNVALLIKLCPPSVLRHGVKQVVLMGGAAGVPGNRAPLAEWNIMVDPEAAAIVFDADLPVVMAGLNVTHQAVFTPQLQQCLLGTRSAQAGPSVAPLRRLVASAMTFFATTYAHEFGFSAGPPIHDMLTVAYVLDETLFSCQPFPAAAAAAAEQEGGGQSRSPSSKTSPPSPPPPPPPPPQRRKVTIDTRDGPTCGATIVDFFSQTPLAADADADAVAVRWGRGTRNAIVLEHVDVSGVAQRRSVSTKCVSTH